MMRLLFPISDWLTIWLANHMIGLGRLLLVVPTYLQLQSPGFSFMGGVEKRKSLNLDVRNNFAGSHTEHHWSWSNLTCGTLVPQRAKKKGMLWKI